MFISQVLFESAPDNKAIIEQVMQIKQGQLEGAPGLITAEYWWRETEASAGFALVTKWQDKADFRKWMKESHKDGHQRPEGAQIEINKTAYQFESVDG